jgi:hypothetical protein
LPIQDPKALDLLPKWREQPGMLGVRVIFNTRPDAFPWLTDGTADRFLAAAEKAGLPVMCFAPGRTRRFGTVADDTRNCNSSSTTWACRGAMAAGQPLAEGSRKRPRSPNIRTSAPRCRHRPARRGSPIRSSDVADHVKRVFDAYGPQRSYWGTDITNSYAKASYRQRITHFTEELSFLSESDKDQ